MLAKIAVFGLLLVNKPAYRQAGATAEMGIEIVAKINNGGGVYLCSSPYRIAASSILMSIFFSVLNLMQYPLTLALPSFFPYVCA